MNTVSFGDVLFVALIVVVPLLAIHSAISLVLLSRSMKGWRAVEGYVDYLHDYDIVGGRWRGTIGTGIEIEYRYSFGEAVFKGDRVSIVDFPPRLWVTQYGGLVAELRAAYSGKKPLQVLVNPDKPHQAVLISPSVRPQLGNVVFFLLADAVLVPGLFLQELSVATWACGVGLGVVVYLLFLAGILSTSF